MKRLAMGCKIRCPRCNTPYFWKRLDRLKYNAGYDVPIRCRCGLKYYIVKDTEGKIISVRRDEWTLIEQMNISERS